MQDTGGDVDGREVHEVNESRDEGMHSLRERVDHLVVVMLAKM